MLHRKIYEQNYGKIPNGWHIHHKDHNHENNDPSNLEALSPDDHAKKHGYLNNFIMAQSTAVERAITKLRQPEIREKMKSSMKSSVKHKEAIEKRSQNTEWYENVSRACRETAKNRTNPVWNKGKAGLQKHDGETKKLMSKQRLGRKWYNDGKNEYFSHEPHKDWNLGRLKRGK